MKKKVISRNYLNRIPIRNHTINYKSDEEGIVTLEVENKGFMNTLLQKLIKKPRTSFIHLDKTGSFVWPLIDGEKTIGDIATLVDEHFGEDSHPLYERLIKYFQILESYGFIKWANK